LQGCRPRPGPRAWPDRGDGRHPHTRRHPGRRPDDGPGTTRRAALAVLLLASNWRESVAEDVTSDVTPEDHAGHVVEAGVDAGVDAAESGFPSDVGVGAERPGDAGQDF